MTDKEYEKQKKRVQRYINKWFDAMGLGWFRVEMVWSRERAEDAPTTDARTYTHWQYRDSSITWFLPAIADCDNEYLEGIVVHEFSHILLAPLLSVDEEKDLPLQHEYATECVARALQRVRDAGSKDKK